MKYAPRRSDGRPLVRLPHADFAGPTCRRLTVAQVPPVPDEAHAFKSRADGDTVRDFKDQRWRYGADGALKFYCRYLPDDQKTDTAVWSETFTA
jgi:hypothetical protein